MSDQEEDKPTVVLDLNALKKQKLKQEEDLANLASELEFNIGPDESSGPKESSLNAAKRTLFPVIFFDFQSNFFESSLEQFPEGYDYQIARSLPELNNYLKSKEFQIVVFNYDGNPKAVNQLCLQIKQKLPSTKTMIIARAISPEKAKLHAATAAGANGYYQLPLKAEKIEKEFQTIFEKVKKLA
jgi:CheY-like chemotaxis protein